MWVPMFTLVAHTYMLDFVDVELQNRIVGVSPSKEQNCRPRSTCEQWTLLFVAQGGAPDSTW